MNARTGRLTIDSVGHEINYRLVGDAPETLVCLHGGPGSSMSYLRRLEELADDRLQVLLYDQLGGGDSDRLGWYDRDGSHDPTISRGPRWTHSNFARCRRR